MKRTSIILLLVAAVVALVYWIWSLLATPIQFEQHFNSRQAAVIEKEEYIIKLVQAYRDSNPNKKFTTNWDELIDFAINGTMEYRSQIYDENNLKNAEILAELRKDKNWKNERIVRVAARDTIFDDDFGVCRLSEEQMRELRYIPFTNNTEEFKLDTATYEVRNYRTHLIRCHAPYIKFSVPLQTPSVPRRKRGTGCRSRQNLRRRCALVCADRKAGDHETEYQ